MLVRGDLVRCVDASLSGPTFRWDGDPPVEGETYTVSSGLAFAEDGTKVIWLEEIKNSPVHDGAYAARRFRKVERRKTDLSIESFLTIKPGQKEEPRRIPEKKKEEVK